MNLLTGSGVSLSLSLLILSPAVLGQAPVTLPAPKIAIVPSAPTVFPGGTVQFFPDTKGANLGPYRWQVNGIDGGDVASGRINTDGLYVAPPNAPATNISVTVLSTKDPDAKTSVPVIIATISPAAATLLPGGKVQFFPDTKGADLGPYIWQVNGIEGGNPASGTITSEGTYKAPASAPASGIRVTVVSARDLNAKDSAPILIGKQAITVQPIPNTVAANGPVKLSATWITGIALPIKWQLNGVDKGNDAVGKIEPVNDSKAIYTAPKDTKNTSSVSVTVLSADGKFSGSATITIVPPSCPNHKCIEIALNNKLRPFKAPRSPLSSFPLKPGEKLMLAVRALDSNTVPVRWSLSPDTNNSGAIGKFTKKSDTAVTYRAPRKPASTPITITATPTIAGYASASVTVFVMEQVLASCHSVKVIPDPKTLPQCTVTDFDRLKGDTGVFPSRTRIGNEDKKKRIEAVPVDASTDTGVVPSRTRIENEDKKKWIEAVPVDASTDAGAVTAINASKTLFSGSVVAVNMRAGANTFNCANYDWKAIVQSEESAGILIYDPSDVGSGVCEGDQFIVALPVHVLWADVFGYPQALDPTRTAPGKPSSYTDCVGQPATQTITPCDKDETNLIAGLYRTGWAYTHLSPPGNGKGTIAFTGKGQVVFDVQADPAFKKGVGWINFPVLFERGPAGANLNSLTFSAAYDFRWIAKPNFTEPTAKGHFIFRKPQFQIRLGPELSPSRPGTASTTGNTRDWNFVWGETFKLPLVINFHDQPSSFSFYSILGAEQGWHLATNLPVKDPIARGVAGGNASFRWPFNVTHNFLGSTPITYEAQYLVRWLAYPEPFADFANLPPAGTPPPCPNRVGIGVMTSSTGQQTCVALNQLSSKAQSFIKGDITVPVDPWVQITVSVTKGSLPPAFWLTGWTYSLGLSFGNTASSEH
jgi:hypothetical protein